MSTTRDVIALAKSNGGVVTNQEAMALGLTKSTLRRRVEDGIFVRVGRGVLALPGTATRSDLAMRAALKRLNAVVSHESAARIHGFEPIPEIPTPSVTVSHRGTHSFPGVVVHQSTDLLEEHVEVIDGIRVTTRARTLVDLAKVLSRRRLERVVEYALATGLVDLEELLDLTTALSRRGKRGMKHLQAILQDLVGNAVSESELERRLFQLIRDSGLPLPVKQFNAPWLQPLNGRVDFAYPEQAIVIEADGRRWHGQFDAFESDKVRDNAAQIAGWMVIRITWRMITEQPSSAVQTIRLALEARSK